MTYVVQMIDEDGQVDVQAVELADYSGGCQPTIVDGQLVHDDFNFASTCISAQSRPPFFSDVKKWLQNALNGCDSELTIHDVNFFVKTVADTADSIGYDNIDKVYLVQGALETELEFSAFILTK